MISDMFEIDKKKLLEKLNEGINNSRYSCTQILEVCV